MKCVFPTARNTPHMNSFCEKIDQLLSTINNISEFAVELCQVKNTSAPEIVKDNFMKSNEKYRKH